MIILPLPPTPVSRIEPPCGRSDGGAHYPPPLPLHPPPSLSHCAPPVGALMAVLTTRPACEPFSLEAAEFVGDAVLKYLASVYLHTALRCGGPLLPHTARIPCNSVLCELSLLPPASPSSLPPSLPPSLTSLRDTARTTRVCSQRGACASSATKCWLHVRRQEGRRGDRMGGD